VGRDALGDQVTSLWGTSLRSGGIERDYRNQATEEAGILRGMHQRPEDLIEAIATGDDLASFLDLLSADAVDRGSEWENGQIDTMLESMSAWLRASTGHPNFTHHPDLLPEQWRFVAELLLAGKHYE
jgi:hypothetical protein